MKYCYLLVVLLSVENINAQWEWQNPCSEKYQFNSVTFIDSLIGWVASDFGIVLKTTNGGIDWYELYTDSDDHLRSITFIDKNIGWVSGDGGAILKTIDGGESWIKSSVGSHISLHSIQFLDQYYGWTCGSGGNILYTSDGGQTWNFSNTGTSYSINSVYFISKYKGWAVLSYSPAPFVAVSKILYTTDGGLNWSHQQQNLDGQMFCIYFLDENNGWVTGTKVYRTLNGNSWNIQSSMSEINFIQFLTPERGWAVGNSGKIIFTNNGGNTWSLQYYFTDNRLMSCVFVNNDIGWIVGKHGIIIKTSDEGNYWKNQTNFFKFSFYSSFFLNPNLGWVAGWAVGQRGPILRTTNSGKNWEPQNMFSHSITSIFFIDSLLGWATGYANGPIAKVYKTTNSGFNWELIRSEDGFRPVGIQFIDNKGWVIDENNIILFTNDGGLNWIKDSLKIELSFLRDFQFLDSLTGWIAGYGGIYLTNDGGINWKRQTQGSFITIHFLDPLNGAAGGTYGRFAKTSNGGNNWEISTTPYDYFDAVFLIDASEVLASVYLWGGYVIRTTNGGVDWNDELRNTASNRIYNVSSNDMINYWALGSNGLICKYSKDPISFVDQINNFPIHFSLSQNYPNPFNPTTRIKYSISNVISTGVRNLTVTLKVFDVLGREIATLVNENKQPGVYEVEFNAEGLASGIYYYQLKSGSFNETKKMIYLK